MIENIFARVRMGNFDGDIATYYRISITIYAHYFLRLAFHCRRDAWITAKHLHAVSFSFTDFIDNYFSASILLPRLYAEAQLLGWKLGTVSQYLYYFIQCFIRPSTCRCFYACQCWAYSSFSHLPALIYDETRYDALYVLRHTHGFRKATSRKHSLSRSLYFRLIFIALFSSSIYFLIIRCDKAIYAAHFVE